MLWLHLSIVFFLILLNGFFAMAEIALVSARPARLQPLAAGGSAGAAAALELKADPSRLLATVQVGVTVIAILSGTFGEATLGDSLERYLDDLPGFARRIRARRQHGGRRDRHRLSRRCCSANWCRSGSRCSIPSGSPARWRGSCAACRVVGAPIEWVLSATADLILRLVPIRGDGTVTGHRRGDRLHAARRRGGRAYPAGRDRDRRDGAAARRPAGQRGDDAAHADRVSRPRRPGRRSPPANPRAAPIRAFRSCKAARTQLAGIVQVKDLLEAVLAGQPFDLRAAMRTPLLPARTR